jgi:hypothetical protein
MSIFKKGEVFIRPVDAGAKENQFRCDFLIAATFFA